MLHILSSDGSLLILLFNNLPPTSERMCDDLLQLSSSFSPSPAHVRQVISKADEKKAGATKGERAANGLVSHIFVPWSYAFIGDDKKQFSGGVAGNERNNAYLAAASHVWPGANSSTDWLGEQDQQ